MRKFENKSISIIFNNSTSLYYKYKLKKIKEKCKILGNMKSGSSIKR